MSNLFFQIKLLKTGFVANGKWRQVPGLSCYVTYIIKFKNPVLKIKIFSI